MPLNTTCITCSKPITYSPSRNRRYCSKACYGEAKLHLSDDFWSKVNKNGPAVTTKLGPCWLWTGARTGKSGGIGRNGGYGNIKFQRRFQYAHRVAWILTNGEIPDGQWVLHRCDVRLCVRPAHLFLGNHADNMADMVSKYRGRGVARKLTDQDAIEIRRRYEDGVSKYRLARDFGVTDTTISNLVQGRTYRSALT